MLPTHNHQSPITSHGEINLFDYWRVIRKYRKMIVAIIASVSVSVVIISLILPKYYRAEATIMPLSSKGGGGGLSALASQFGGLASLAGVSLPGSATEAEKIVAILKSRTLTENVINSENLMPILFSKAWDVKAGKWKNDDPKKWPDMEMAVLAIKDAIIIVDDKKNKTIKISGVFRKSDISARVVNAYLDKLEEFINNNALTMAKRNRIFIEGQLEGNKRELLEAGKEINEFYQGNKVSSSEARIDVPLNSISLEQNNQYASLDNGLLNNLLTQKVDIEKKISVAKVVQNVPQQVFLSYLMLRRELLAKVNALLTTQYEMAKIEESKEELSFQTIDKAVPPVKKFKPKRAQICIMSFMAALFGAIFLAFFREYLERMKQLHNMEQMDGRR